MNTALGANKTSNHTQILFKNEKHKEFYYQSLERCRYQDEYHKALAYCLGISEDTRVNADRIYDFTTGLVKVRCLNEGWQTSGSLRIVRMAYNLYCNGTPSVKESAKAQERLAECQRYTVEDLFCCSYAKYFWEAIKIRYPEYCFYKEINWEDMYAEN